MRAISTHKPRRVPIWRRLFLKIARRPRFWLRRFDPKMPSNWEQQP